MLRHSRLSGLLAAALLAGCAGALLAGCAGVDWDAVSAPEGPAPGGRELVLFDPANAIQDDWQALPLKTPTEYGVGQRDGKLSIRAEGRNSASGIARRVEFDARTCPTLEWSWRVERLQPSADIRNRAKEDVAASIALLFGDPGFLTNPTPVPTLRYVWSSAHTAEGTVVPWPFQPDVVINMVLRAGEAQLGRWVQERRDVVADFTRAFGRPPPGPIHMVALWTDNDQTREPVEAHYGRATVRCGG